MRISDWSSDVCSSDLEGVSFDPDGKKLYVAYSEINSGMEDNKKAGVANTGNDIGGPNDIKLRYNQRTEEHTSELQSLMRISYADFCRKKKKTRLINYKTVENQTHKMQIIQPAYLK